MPTLPGLINYPCPGKSTPREKNLPPLVNRYADGELSPRRHFPRVPLSSVSDYFASPLWWARPFTAPKFTDLYRKPCKSTRERSTNPTEAVLDLVEKGFKYEKLWWNAVYYTAWSLLVILKHSCIKLRCIKVSLQTIFREIFLGTPPACQREAELHPRSDAWQ